MSGLVGQVGARSGTIPFAKGNLVFIERVLRDGAGSVGTPTSYYPVSVSDLGTDSVYAAITASDHAGFTKLKVDYTTNFRLNEGSSHTLMDFKMVRWTGGGDIASETVLIEGSIGDVTSTLETYYSVSGSFVDDISSLGSVTISYAMQYRAMGGSSANCGAIFFGQDSSDKLQLSVYGII